MTRTITPHKGGRTASLHVLCTPATKARLVAIADRLGMSQGDLIEHWVNTWWAASEATYPPAYQPVNAWWAEPVRELPSPPAKEDVEDNSLPDR